MSDIAIRAESLGKRYRIRQGTRARYDTLRDTLANLGSRIVHLGRPFNRRSTIGNPDSDYVWALQDVSFEVRRGEAIGVIGRNGAGKTTLLKVLSRITEPTAGRAEVRGRVGSLLEVGTGFHPELTGRENIYLNGAILGMKKAEIDRRFDEIVAFAEVEKYVDTPVKFYSSGMGVRLAFAVAAHLEPEILLVDEVLAVGDAQFQKKCLGKMSNVAGEGRTVLFVSHQMGAVQNLCDWAMVLENGCLVQAGPVEQSIQFYLAKLQETTRGISLSDRSDRQGFGPFRFENVLFRDKHTRQPLQTILSGQDVIIEVSYRTADGKAPEGLRVSIGFRTSAGQFMFACSNDAIGASFSKLPARGCLICEVPRWPLTSGVYTYTLYSSQNRVLSDRIRDAGVVEVQSGDYYGTGRLPSPYQGLLVNYAWYALEGE